MINEQSARRRGLAVRDAVVFLVDWRTAMLRKEDYIDISEDISQDTPCMLSLTLRCIADVIKSKIVARTGDAVSVIAFGARGSGTRRNWPGIRIIRPLKSSDANAVVMLQNLAKSIENGEADHFLEQSSEELRSAPVPEGNQWFCFGPNGSTEFDKALWAARHQFTAVSASRFSVLHRKRVFVFTNDEDPSRGTRAIRKQCESQLKDLHDMGAAVYVSVLLSPSKLTDSAANDQILMAEFFSNLIYSNEDNVNEDKGDVTIATIYSFEDLRSRIRRKEMTKRAIRRTVLVLGPNYRIGVMMYALVRKAVRPQKVELAASTKKPVFKITTNTCDSAGTTLKPEEIRKTFTPPYLRDTKLATPELSAVEEESILNGDSPKPDEVDSASIPKVHGFTSSEVTKAKALGKVGIYLYGFRKAHHMKSEYTMGPPTFLFPDDSEYSGSTQAFATLLKCMLRRKVIAIVAVRLSASSGVGMRFAALVPQEEDFAEDIEKSIPGGFQLHYLPYKDDVYTEWRKEIKELKEDVKIEPKEEELIAELDESESVIVARRMVKQLELEPYSPNNFLNPDLQRFYTGLENAAGIENTYQPQDEMLNPKVPEMQSRAQSDMEELKKLDAGVDFDGEEEAERFGKKSAKRAAEQAEAARQRAAKKKAVMEEAKQACDDTVYIDRFHDNSLRKLKKPDLQLYCRAHGLPDKGTKDNLIILIEDDIEKHLQSSNPNEDAN
ncbi:Ku core domain Ku70 family [Gracilaria domingensis]|nr:Ku core domain Ku70 family [Gracilaria domingensis]